MLAWGQNRNVVVTVAEQVPIGTGWIQTEGDTLGEESALIFGNSGGAVIALEIASIRPQAVRLAVVHEAPTVRLLPDADKWTRFFAACHATASRFGPRIAMLRFALSTRIPIAALRAVPHDVAQRLSRNHEFFVKHEMVPFASYQPDFDKLRKGSARIVASAGR